MKNKIAIIGLDMLAYLWLDFSLQNIWLLDMILTLTVNELSNGIDTTKKFRKNY